VQHREGAIVATPATASPWWRSSTDVFRTCTSG